MTDELPPGWSWARLGDFGTWTSGGTPSKSHPEYFGGDIPWVKTGDLRDGPIASVPDSLSEAGLANSSAKRFPSGTLLVAMYGATIGKLGVLTATSATNQACAALLPSTSNESALPYLFKYLLSRREHIKALGQGGAQPNISQGIIKDLMVPVAPLREQARIVSKIDELFSRIDEGERALEQVQKLVERYRQSVLKAAVTGELTRDWREKNKHQLESGEALLVRILKARREAWEVAELDKMKAKGIAPANDKWKQKYEEPWAPGADDLPPLPENWTYVSVEQLCFVDTGATPKRGEARYFKDGAINWVTSTAVNEAVILEAQERITQAAIDETNAKVFPAGTFIVAMYGEGKTRGRIAELGIAAATNQACAALICGHLDPLVKAYVRTFFEKNYAALRASAAGGVQPNLNLGILKKTYLPLPPLAEMKVINDVSAAGLSQASAIAMEFLSWERRSTALRQKILSAAFAGGLVPQVSGDEPASELLERIAAGRTDASAKPDRGRKSKTSEPA